MRVARALVIAGVTGGLGAFGLLAGRTLARPASGTSRPPPALTANALADRFESLRASYADMTYAQLGERLHLQSLPGDARLGFDPTGVRYYDEVRKALALTTAEEEIYRRSGLVSVDHDQRYNMASAYLAIYQRDLPVLITADSMLHALHRSFDNILIEIERDDLAPALAKVLEGAHDRLKTEAVAVREAELRDSVRDIDLYLTVARNLLAGTDAPEPNGWSQPTMPDCRDPALARSPACRDFAASRILNGNLKVASAFDQDDAVRDILKRVASLVPDESVPLYGGGRPVDWSQFKPRGHYANKPALERYFRAMMWLGRADVGFHLSADQASSAPEYAVRQRRDMAVLAGLLGRAGQLDALAKIDRVLQFVVGESDNITPADVDAILEGAGLRHLADLGSDTGVDHVMRELAARGARRQLIRSQLVGSTGGHAPETPLPDLFQLFGQRFVLDSYVLTRVVFDSILFGGERKERMMPSGLDVMAALGNDEAVVLLAPELERYKYSANLLAARELLEEQPRAVWDATAYNVWLDTLAQLSRPPAGGEVPEVMRSREWRRKQLQTQLASWAELRHDTILYVKQSYTTMSLCQYPAAYVEPYPAFFARVAFLVEEIGKRLAAANVAGAGLKEFVANFATTMRKLEHLAEKELAGQPFDSEEDKFVKDTIHLKVVSRGCGGPSRIYSGWYTKLFYLAGADSWEPTVADVHTDPNSGILEEGVGDANFLVAAVDNRGDRSAYVGPVYSYYEFVSGERLRDDEWRAKVGTPQMPPRPQWTRAFLAPAKRRAMGTPTVPDPPEPSPLLPDSPPTARRSSAAAPEKPLALQPLSKAAVVAGMNAIRPRVLACYDIYQVQGLALVNVHIAPDGTVASAVVTGKLAGTPTATCVEKVVRSAMFPRSQGLAFPYPFQLR